MPVFEYKALTHDGKRATGTLDADTPREAREKLRGQKLLVTDLVAVAAPGAPGTPSAEAPPSAAAALMRRARVGRPSFGQEMLGLVGALRSGRALRAARDWFGTTRRLSEVAMVTRQMATILGAGIPLAQGLSVLTEQIETKDLVIAVRDIRERITQGMAFGDALTLHPRFFSDLYVNMVRAGEAAGNLDIVLSQLADYIQAQTRLRGKVGAALAYPMILSILGVIVVVFLLVFVLPKMVEIFEKQKQALPFITEMVIGASHFVRASWWALGAGAVALWVLFRMFKATTRGRWAWDRFKLRVPIFGELMRKSQVSRFCVTFATLLESGIPALECLRIVQRIVQNVVLEKTIEDVHNCIIEGSDISSPLKKSGVFPPVVGYMIAVGEQTGQLEDILKRISAAYDEELSLAVEKFTSLIEPVMIVLLAVIVGIIVAAIMLPIFNMASLVTA
ncbi:MAG: type II secretion system F family protein [Planctomycetes bacterium]|nr:type II secretion system F family protein [Planctomycetota bacterium]